jgi:hypothetical protein
MIVTNVLNLPQALVDAVTLEKHNAEGEVSATTLIKGVKEILLTDRHWDEITIDVKDSIWALWGTTTHALLEKEYASTFTEEMFEQKVGNLTVTGKVDCYDMEHEVLFDYKTTSVWKIVYKNFEDWYMQGMIYAWLLSKKGLSVNKCRFVSLLRDWSETESQRKADYPSSPVFVYEFDVTKADLEDVETVINFKVSQLEKNKEVADDEITPCDRSERWASDDVYAVMKEGRKTSVKNFDNEEDAENLAKELGDKHSVEVRPGIDKKCTRYCSCCEFCNYYREHYGNKEEGKVEL